MIILEYHMDYIKLIIKNFLVLCLGTAKGSENVDIKSVCLVCRLYFYE